MLRLALVAGRAKRPQVIFIIRSSLADGNDMVNVQTHLTPGYIGVGIARRRAALLTGEAVAL